MAGQADSAKDAEMARRLKEQGVTRTTAACPNHCGAMVSVVGATGKGLLTHLARCGQR